MKLKQTNKICFTSACACMCVCGTFAPSDKEGLFNNVMQKVNYLIPFIMSLPFQFTLGLVDLAHVKHFIKSFSVSL